MNSKIVIIRNAAKSDFGGAERMPVYLAREFKNHGQETIILTRSKKLQSFAGSQGVRTKQSWWWSKQNWSSTQIMFTPIYFIWQVVLYFYYLVTFIKLKPSLVSPQSKDDFIPATLAAKTLGVKTVWVDHGDIKAIWKNHGVWYKNPVGKLVYFAAKFTDVILTASKNELSLVANEVPGSEILNKFKVVYNGIYDSYKNTSQPPSIDFISTGRLVTDKGIGELVEAFAGVIKKYPKATLAIVGDGPERTKFKEQAKNIPGVTFYGHQENPLEYLAKSKIFILPTYHEAFGVAVVEACMEQKPIIASNIGGIPEIITHNKSGLLIPIKDTDALYDAMIELYENPSLQKKLATNARKTYLEKFKLDGVVIDNYLKYFGNKL